MNQKKIKILIFDLDGTLVDSMGYFSNIAKSTIHRFFGVDKEESVLMYRDTSGMPFLHQLERLFPGDPRIEQAYQQFEQEKLKSYDSQPLFDGVESSLSDLCGMGYRLAISSNNYLVNVGNRMKPHKDLFCEMLGYEDEFYKGKHHFEFIMDKFKISPDETLFVGDSLHDARVAYENNVSFLAKIGTFKKEDFDQLDLPMHQMHDFPEIFSVLNTLNNKG